MWAKTLARISLPLANYPVTTRVIFLQQIHLVHLPFHAASLRPFWNIYPCLSTFGYEILQMTKVWLPQVCRNSIRTRNKRIPRVLDNGSQPIRNEVMSIWFYWIVKFKNNRLRYMLSGRFSSKILTETTWPTRKDTDCQCKKNMYVRPKIDVLSVYKVHIQSMYVFSVKNETIRIKYDRR